MEPSYLLEIFPVNSPDNAGPESDIPKCFTTRVTECFSIYQFSNSNRSSGRESMYKITKDSNFS